MPARHPEHSLYGRRGRRSRRRSRPPAGGSTFQPKKRYGLGAVNYHTGETIVLIRQRKRLRETAELLQALVDRHPSGMIYVAWDNASTHENDEVKAAMRGAVGSLVLLYLPTYSP